METITKGQRITLAILSGIEILVSIANLVLLIIFSHTSMTIITTSIAYTLVILFYLFSIMYHSLKNNSTGKKVFLSLQTSTFLLLPFTIHMMIGLNQIKSWLGWTIFGGSLGISAAVVALNSVFLKKGKIYKIIYCVMSYLILIPILSLTTKLTIKDNVLLEIGGFLHIFSFYLLMKDTFIRKLLFHITYLLGNIVIFFYYLFYIV